MRGKLIARYLRISDEDGREGGSIDAQRAVIDRHLDTLPELCGATRADYIDNGISGTHFRRPAFCRMVEDVRSGLVGCVAVKDLSRFGRDYLTVGDWVEQIFPFLGVRFLSVGDGLDSAAGQGAAGSLESALKALVHQSYSADLSRKIASARWTRARLGRPPVAFVPYGYRKVDGRVEADPETGAVVQWLFAQRTAGRSGASLARQLNLEGVPAPSQVKKRQGSSLFCPNHGGWTPATVGRILNDIRYTGAGRYRTGEGEVLEFSDGFPPLIGREDCCEGDKRGYKKGKQTGLQVRCGCCGYAVPRRTHREGASDYRCRRHWATGKAPCPTGCWNGEKLTELWERLSRMFVRMVRRPDKAAQQALLSYRRGRILMPEPAPELPPALPCTVILEEGQRLTVRLPFRLS